MNWLMRRAASVSSNIINKGGSNIGPSGLRYRIGIISDVHCQEGDTSPYTNGTAHFKAALKTLDELKAQSIICCGDCCGQNSTEANWALYDGAIQSSPFKNDGSVFQKRVFTTNGNHDGLGSELFMSKANKHNGLTERTTPYFSIDLFGDHFIFMAFDVGTKPSGGEVFSSAQMTWLNQELEEHYGKGKNVWLVEHALFYDWGTGDVISAAGTTPKYSNALNMNNTRNKELKAILEAHPDMIMLHGHSHIQLEDVNKGLDVYAPPASGGCHQLHVPSICAQKELPGMGVVSSYGESECWFCEVYTDKIVMQGIYSTGGNIPNMTYIIELNK